jgi:DNA-binding XRE family transcriptional regulator
MPRTKPVKSVVEILRRELGLRQGEFAERVGLSRRSIQEVEYGAALSWKSARAISLQFNVDANWLMQNDLGQPITTISGKPWTQKGRDNLQPLKNREPVAKAAALIVSQKAIRPLLEDYLKFRSFFLFAALSAPEEIDHWREIQDRAWNEFLKDSSDALVELSKGAASGGRGLSRADLESIKEDVELVIQIPPLLEKETARKAGSKKAYGKRG